MVGDAMTDFDCARDCKLRFLGRADAASDMGAAFPPGTVLIRDFDDPDLDTALRQLYRTEDAGARS